MYITESTEDDDLTLILGLALGIGIPVIIILFILHLCCCCPCCLLYGKCRKKGEFSLFIFSINVTNICVKEAMLYTEYGPTDIFRKVAVKFDILPVT